MKNEHSLYRGEDCMGKFCISLTEHAFDKINFEKKKNVTINKKELKLHRDAKQCYICPKKIRIKTD